MVSESIIVERLEVRDNHFNILSSQEKFEIMEFYKFFRFYLDSFLLKTVILEQNAYILNIVPNFQVWLF